MGAGWTTASIRSTLRRGPRGQHVWKTSQGNLGGLRRWEISPNHLHKLASPARRQASPERSESLIVALICSTSKEQGAKGDTYSTREGEAKDAGMAGATRIITPNKVRELQIVLYRKAKAQPKYRFWSL